MLRRTIPLLSKSQKLLATAAPSLPGSFTSPLETLNVVFAPGAFGGQLMAQALSSAIATAPVDMSVGSMNCAFLGPTVVGKDVDYVVEDVRESGRSFITKRVRSFQGGENVNFEATIDFFRPNENGDEADMSFTKIAGYEGIDTSADIIANSLDLKDVKVLIKSGELKRGPLYSMALSLAAKLSEADMHMTIRIPKTTGDDIGSGRSSYFVGVDEDLISGLSGANLNRVILPYVSDGMTQVLACCDPLDANGWDKWPSKISTWNYGLWFPTAKAGGDEKLLIDGDGKKWFLVTYDIVGCELGKGVGRVQVYDWADEKKLASTGHFGALCRK